MNSLFFLETFELSDTMTSILMYYIVHVHCLANPSEPLLYFNNSFILISKNGRVDYKINNASIGVVSVCINTHKGNA